MSDTIPIPRTEESGSMTYAELYAQLAAAKKENKAMQRRALQTASKLADEIVLKFFSEDLTPERLKSLISVRVGQKLDAANQAAAGMRETLEICVEALEEMLAYHGMMSHSGVKKSGEALTAAYAILNRMKGT